MHHNAIDPLKTALMPLLTSTDPATAHVADLTLHYLPPRPGDDQHRLWLTRQGGRVSYEESQTALTALMAAIYAAGHAIAEPGIDMVVGQAKAGRPGSDAPSFATRYEWRLYRQLPLQLAGDES